MGTEATGKRQLPRGRTNGKLRVSVTPRHMEVIDRCTHNDGRRIMRNAEFLRALIDQGETAKLPILAAVWRGK